MSKRFQIKQVTQTPTPTILDVFKTDKRYLEFKDVKRAYSKLIQEFCKGTVKNEDARTLAYLFSGYISTIKNFEIEERVRVLEENAEYRSPA